MREGWPLLNGGSGPDFCTGSAKLFCVLCTALSPPAPGVVVGGRAGVVSIHPLSGSRALSLRRYARRKVAETPNRRIFASRRSVPQSFRFHCFLRAPTDDGCSNKGSRGLYTTITCNRATVATFLIFRFLKFRIYQKNQISYENALYVT